MDKRHDAANTARQNTHTKKNAMYHLTLKSSNVKTGPIPVSTSSRDNCPPSCPFYGNGCYADSGPLKLHWNAVTAGKRGDDWQTFVAKIAALPLGQFWRHNQAGDLPGFGDVIDRDALKELTAANTGKKGFTYTHKPMFFNTSAGGYLAENNRRAVRDANRDGFTVNLSGNTLEHADTLAALNIAPVCVVLPSNAKTNTVTPQGRKVVICPATQRDNVTCDSCRLCSKSKRTCIIGFPAHGTGARKASAVAQG